MASSTATRPPSHTCSGNAGGGGTITSGARLGATHNVPYGMSKGAVWSVKGASG
ncbi:MAG: hypothetical protein KatS3mg052_0566 [Candidatus Roseilinea sp.]|nr:MAG: hypothetical protein KatS3mg052_0566 [Candidatus Roseilinea sp.]